MSQRLGTERQPPDVSAVRCETGRDGAGGRRSRATSALATLSEREHEVALAIADGKSNAEIAEELYMSVATVKAHVSRMLTRLELNNRVQIALLVHDADES